MHEEVFPGLHRIDLPLPKSPLKGVNCYLIEGEDRWLLIDTGLHLDICREVMEQSLDELGVDRDKLDFFITHLHSDHIGQLGYLAKEHSTVYFNANEANTVALASEEKGFKTYIVMLAKLSGFAGDELHKSLADHPGGEWRGPRWTNFTILNDGDKLEIGDFTFEVISTPGHSPGHLCLYEASRKLMVTGDHVLAEISPNISPWGFDDNPLQDFLDSLDKVRDYDVELALPGHRRLITDLPKRVDELKSHHRERLDEIVQILNGAPMTPYDIASKMTWDLKYDHWDDVNVMQKWFASNEAVAHLRLLSAQGQVQSTIEDDVLRFWST